MKEKTINGVAVEISSGNVFADLGFRDAEKHKIKSGLAFEIIKSIKRLGLTQTTAGERIGISQAKVSHLFRGDFSNLSERKMMECLNRLGCDIEITVKPTTAQTGHLILAHSG
ncbi:helix-turn-helix domain-containing protein [Photorhabdus laumondii subsp. laumondii]|uniref:Photorhabdus luminescens subsp. laumondii TTO1 complete genome segment 5/17 n=6 Tax=Photorhabdus TaxID=29487 RepID=Q7N7C9_PHOLL|nr:MULTISPECIES: helix-turn-helix transcriptional regulator [Photorhabdus]KGM26341.1 XRE family transcriptional regulator [Photorhabdus luminescens]MCE1914822.1 helix-turn-helix domain-containing protein [Enterobacter hormaechei]AWK41110.1 XRE family transcriptional regulator [Photorhabdus laumondii subsp. laumondii]AXG41849.1 XRE family transcriptional regulator [Photorhabdus laumondii subsp. laumondii]AXG46437.1 XRE family transcriptional regulator [Photorhabdus laumondii subsp. laumondii]